MQLVGERAKPPFSCLTHLGTPDPVICVWVPWTLGCSLILLVHYRLFFFFLLFLPSHWGRPGSRLLFLACRSPLFRLTSFVGLQFSPWARNRKRKRRSTQPTPPCCVRTTRNACQVDKLGCDGTEQGLRSCLHVQLRIKSSTTVIFYL
jgi:hypothetical protein